MNFITRHFLFIVLVFNSFQIFAQNQVPVVQNVTFSQRTDGTFLVDIYYDVNNPEGSSMIVSMRVSTDNGSTWSLDYYSVTGDIGPWVTNGTNKHIVWDFALDHPYISYDQVRIKVLADDGGPSCPGQPTITYEGKTYNTVQVGSQCWMRENLNVGIRIQYDPVNYTWQSDNDTTEKFCYDNLESNCDKYGGLYTWYEAMQYVTDEGARGICPEGWHIPTLADFEILKAAVNNDGNALKAVGEDSTSTNVGGFSALLAGAYWFNMSGANWWLHRYGFFWSSTYIPPARKIVLSHDSAEILYFMTIMRDPFEMDGISVRCIKN